LAHKVKANMAYGNGTRGMGGRHDHKLWLTGQLRVRVGASRVDVKGAQAKGRECEDGRGCPGKQGDGKGEGSDNRR